MGLRLSGAREALEYLYARTTGQWRLGTQRTVALLAEMENPHHGLKFVHVGGTNGKGSVCATLEAVLRARGFRVAAYTSPHLVDFGERIRVDGVPVPEAHIVEFVTELTPAIERIGATFFEATTALALREFARAQPDIVILEVGLGGRLDATNVVDPLVAVVTNVGLDHTEYLGDTRDTIAREKAGIFKRARGAVIGEPDRRVRALLREAARAAGSAPVRSVHDELGISDVVVSSAGTTCSLAWTGAAATEIACRTPLVGAHQATNTATALVALDALPPPFRTAAEAAIPALAGLELPGRFQREGAFVFDVAHNREGAAVLAASLGAVQLPRPIVAVLSVLGDKDWRGMLEELAPVVDEFILTTARTAPPHRAWDPAAAHQVAGAMGCTSTIAASFDHALADARTRGRTVVVTGSFHTVGDAMARLHVSPLRG